MALAVVVVGVLEGFVPDDFRLFPKWVFPSFLLCFLAVLMVDVPGRIDRQRRWLRVTTSAMICFIALVTAGALIRLMGGIIGHARWASAGELLEVVSCQCESSWWRSQDPSSDFARHVWDTLSPC